MLPLYQYQDGRDVFLREISQAKRLLEEYAEKNGGAQAMPENIARSYNARRNALITYVHFYDVAENYIRFLEQYNAELREEKQQAQAQLRSARDDWQQHFPRMSLRGESEKEYLREITITKLKMQMPRLF